MRVSSRSIWARILFGIVAIAALGGYTLFEARRFLAGPIITVTNPALGSVIEDRLVMLTAQTKNVTKVSVNGRDTYVTEQGLLQEPILLQKGYTVVRIAAEDRFGHTAEERLEFYTIDN